MKYQKILTVGVAAALVTPMATHAEVKFYGQIGAEAASVEYAGGDDNITRGTLDKGLNFTKKSDDMGRQTLTKDRFGNILNDGPNLIGFDFELDKKLGGVVTPQARYRTTFHTTNNSGFGPGLEAWLGLKTDRFYLRYGKLRGAYRSAKGLIDPWIYTSMQARGSGGGMSSGRYNEVHWNWDATGGRSVVAQADGTVGIQHGRAINTSGLIHNSDIGGALEMGGKFGPFSTRVQLMADDADDKSGGNVEFKLTTDSMLVWLHGAYLDQGSNQINLGGADWNNETFTNWKIGSRYEIIPGLKVALQYEDGELGTFDNNPDGGKYIIGSLIA